MYVQPNRGAERQLPALGDFGVTCMTMDADGSRFVCTASALYMFSPWQTLLAGHKSEEGFKDGDGPEARFNCPRGIALDLHGNVLLADTCNHALRQVTRTGAVTTVAGSMLGEEGYADGVGAAARFYSPWGIAVDAHGTIFVADSSNHCLRKVAPGDGAVSTLAGKGEEAGYVDAQGASARFHDPRGLAMDTDSNLIVADLGNNCIRRVATAKLFVGNYSLLGRVTTVAGRRGKESFADGEAADALFSSPIGVVVDGDNNVLVADSGNHRIRCAMCWCVCV